MKITNHNYEEAIAKNANKKNVKKKPFYKKWWFWLIVFVFVVGIAGSNESSNESEAELVSNEAIVETTETEATTAITETIETAEAEVTEATTEIEVSVEESQIDSKLDNICFNPMKVRNDATDNWRISLIAENIDIQDYALDYYKEYFENDNQIHVIVNFNYNTTTSISVVGNMLDVTIHEYVAKEEHDAKLLLSGTVLKEYHISMKTGKIEELQ